jgi:hypothetical protein
MWVSIVFDERATGFACEILPAPHCSSLLLTAPPCSSLLLTAPHCSSLLLTAPHCSSLLLIAPHCSSLLLTAPHCSSPLLTAPHRSCSSRPRLTVLLAPRRSLLTAPHGSSRLLTAPYCSAPLLHRSSVFCCPFATYRPSLLLTDVRLHRTKHHVSPDLECPDPLTSLPFPSPPPHPRRSRIQTELLHASALYPVYSYSARPAAALSAPNLPACASAYFFYSLPALSAACCPGCCARTCTLWLIGALQCLPASCFCLFLPVSACFCLFLPVSLSSACLLCLLAVSTTNCWGFAGSWGQQPCQEDRHPSWESDGRTKGGVLWGSS